jgi:hypothetical protein
MVREKAVRDKGGLAIKDDSIFLIVLSNYIFLIVLSNYMMAD